MVTTIEVDVDELWTSTVASTPIMSPTTGFLSSSLSLNTLPACLPPRSLNEVLRRSREQTKAHSRKRRVHNFSMPSSTRLAFSDGGRSEKEKKTYMVSSSGFKLGLFKIYTIIFV